MFIDKEFVSHAGILLDFKIDCDYLSDEDWTTISKIIIKKYKFSDVIGIPTGGIKLQNELKKYATLDKNDPIMIVDDVLTTGLSFIEIINKLNIDDSNVIGVVVFARIKPKYDWIKPIFQLWYE